MMSNYVVAGAVQRAATVTMVSKADATPTATDGEQSGNGLNPKNVRRGAVARPGRARIRANRLATTFA